MIINKPTKNNQNVQIIKKQIDDLLADAKRVNKDIDAANKTAQKNMSELNTKVDKSISKVTKVFADLDSIDKEAGDKLDTLILEQVKDVVGE